MNGTIREHLKPGLKVKIVLKKDQRSGVLTEGIIKSILTKSAIHPHGIKVLLENGAIGRVKELSNDINGNTTSAQGSMCLCPRCHHFHVQG